MPTRASKTTATLHDAMRRKVIVRFVRPFEQGSFTGYVLDIVETFFLLAALNEGFEFEQYSCLRIADVRNLESPAAHEAFYKAVRKKRGDKVPKKIRVDLTNALSILRTLHPSLVTVHRERIAPDTCIIGRTTSDNGIDFEFLEIDPYAQ